jgi:hypothetical protein
MDECCGGNTIPMGIWICAIIPTFAWLTQSMIAACKYPFPPDHSIQLFSLDGLLYQNV